MLSVYHSLRICPFPLGCPSYWHRVTCRMSPSLGLSFLECNTCTSFLVLAPKVLHPRTPPPPPILGKPEQSVTLPMGETKAHLKESWSELNGTCESTQLGPHRRTRTPCINGRRKDRSFLSARWGPDPEPGSQHRHILAVCPEFGLSPWASVSSDF